MTRPTTTQVIDIAARQATFRLLAGIHLGLALPSDQRILAGVLTWTQGYSRRSENVYLGQIAQTSGHWDGPAADCPKATRVLIGRRLAVLAQLGCVDYLPATGGRRVRPGWVGLPSVVAGFTAITITQVLDDPAGFTVACWLSRLALQARPKQAQARATGATQTDPDSRHNDKAGAKGTPSQARATARQARAAQSQARATQPPSRRDTPRVTPSGGTLGDGDREKGPGRNGSASAPPPAPHDDQGEGWAEHPPPPDGFNYDDWHRCMAKLTPAQAAEVLDIIPEQLDIDTGDGTIHAVAANALWVIAQSHDLDLGWSTT